MLNSLDKESMNIVSLEDPIEYNIEGINQAQVHPEIDFTFAEGLRSILRQDPDVIMVGEIRDKETAAMAIHAALTGHIVLSTLHTNNVLGVIPRLIDMGVDPYLISPTLILAIGQRLVQRLCKESKKRIKPTGKMQEIIKGEIAAMPQAIRDRLEKEAAQFIYESEVGPMCPRGTRGRIGVFEVMTMTPELENIILHDPSESNIAEEAKRQDMTTMRQDGILKMLRGEIGFKGLFEVI
jgi:type II secretory ATPase GspE/PulE/Tfp pilus assembly ATPase PilB-like protein